MFLAVYELGKIYFIKKVEENSIRFAKHNTINPGKGKRMKIFIMVDMEGISGICRADQARPGEDAFNAGRKYLTWDVNACIEGCFRGGAKKVTVRDAHYYGHNLIWEDLDPRADYVQGETGVERMPGLQDYDGLILLGYHAMAGTPKAILEHTMSSKEWQNFWMNGKKSGEIAIDAAIAGDKNVPVILVSGDDKACGEARRFIPGVITAQVKKGLAMDGGILLAKEKAHTLIRENATLAVKSCKKIKPYKVKHPVTMRLELVSRGKIPAGRPYVKVVDGRTFEVTGPTAEASLLMLD
ncbi:MAG: hypothetical protein A2268_00410 [Candidatus Raymondbacteria bacterium RifOxyA12_full_50_37]|uniref:Aminopeptidase n=1 Tax=Candidatus Raymondbacteria bacterium RIFOXYD12_FULL_49_13 TaxID=1817890 RepID=A0A1F7F2W1_UNCRA|nr:MAG: hypothetical protein A2268_00410 [Candidatus Raymondbacteria bacterium RifOxyA12_full_50_37]OGJ92779.1 MAG: hypothetical protein A2248_04460 [Candidatus Raymondbacteria bacterium RIFOXYA2_FULL_49_16]OGK00280.1 MAG: hypothetical protein A2350_16595 [Candidatus Raymondbacteria bacterium RifOxyB12_full_50_8]OGK00981.1 MAG: hypothetical protein A2519_17120 [Candidatus Raymondbacteria bacterium RIFOXYD12_FULL_49_13]OGK02455.1 MAG: hypothetical protein A2487_20765 [Candidatus Raymondbacteria 